MDEQLDRVSLLKRPGILVIGSSNVGKRTILSRLLSVDFEDVSDSSSEILGYGWTINTKYYSADVSVWMAHLDDGFSVGMLPISNQLAALVMVFDLTDLSSFAALQDWVSESDILNFDILICIGNKVDLLPGHIAHAEYRRHLQRRGESSSDPHPEFLDYGILETEGSSLLEDEEPSMEISRRSCLEWCSQYNIEYIEACATNTDFDKCNILFVALFSCISSETNKLFLTGLSVDDDSQGVERLYGALSAYMWPGMILKSGNKISEPSPLKKELSEESDYEIEYEILSEGVADPWDDTDVVWVSSSGPVAATDTGGQLNKHDREPEVNDDAGELQPSTSEAPLQEEFDREVVSKSPEFEKATEPDEGKHLGFENLEHLMSEIGNMRDSLRLMPDFQRREMAAKLAMKMASMFGDSSDDEEGFY
ncbi:hypothetical protein HHK36_002414 [Tetracentron sinense]|uniref:Uncharacterized protein n=1 Tax=Tetracentron sinense TaxID=13715 RepID=A0A834ZVG6_TETSI|nr:hypothetical protein HHK36_002414 [Tetracentron sinense]